jgi:hypothetical protein
MQGTLVPGSPAGRAGRSGGTYLNTMGYAMRLRWGWLARTDPSRTWTALLTNAERVVRAMFEASTTVHVGDDRNTLFCQDKWLEGDSIRCLAPDL